jgi:hypothetical protein
VIVNDDIEPRNSDGASRFKSECVAETAADWGVKLDTKPFVPGRSGLLTFAFSLA